MTGDRKESENEGRKGMREKERGEEEERGKKRREEKRRNGQWGRKGQ